jgi:hypothetical protein
MLQEVLGPRSGSRTGPGRPPPPPQWGLLAGQKRHPLESLRLWAQGAVAGLLQALVGLEMVYLGAGVEELTAHQQGGPVPAGAPRAALPGGPGQPASPAAPRQH